MSMLNFTFNEADLPKNDFELLPRGNYIAQIIKTEIKDNKSGTGNRLSMTFQILDGEKTGRMVFHDITIRNDNPIAEKIGREQLASLCKAVGLTHVGDTTELHERPMQIRVAIREDKTGQYEPRNEIKGFMPAGKAPSNSYAQPSAPQQPQTQAAAAPWARA